MRSATADDPSEPADDAWANPRVGALIERAEQRQLSGDHAGALEVLDEVVAVPGADAAYAMAVRAASLFALDRGAEARSQLDVLRKHRPFSAIAFHRAAEAAETSNDQRLALRWFDMAVSRSVDLVALGGPSDAAMTAQIALLVIGRARVRKSLGLPPDELDSAASTAPDAAYPNELPPGVATPKTVVRVLFWPRDEIGSAAARWPALVQTTEVESFTRRRELDNRRIVSEDGARIVMVPITVAALEEYCARTNSDALDPMTRTNLLQDRYDEGFRVAWPPARNSRCWCGSGVKYKKCCGSASFDY
ncbi:SEC-C domain-containing protein [Nakamurella sp. GG22]